MANIDIGGVRPQVRARIDALIALRLRRIQTMLLGSAFASAAIVGAAAAFVLALY
ncbi:hypothetical protein [Arsenicitalea aurantiaca]|uniref:hypothetical protein n=1 Tax=Arsenicitalea aurantiaca TaxID=1783274 RepID=UPI0013151B88|nr:hypothetical protein [Arsenicitalea aurantiaca]